MHFSESISSDLSESEPVGSFPVNIDGNGEGGTPWHDLRCRVDGLFSRSRLRVMMAVP